MFWDRRFIYMDFIIGVTAGGDMLVLGSVLLARHGNRIEQFIGGRISLFGIMFKDDYFPHRHLPAAG